MTNTVLTCSDSTGVCASHNTVPPYEFTGKSPFTSSDVAQQLLEERDGPGSWVFINKSAGGTGFGDWLPGRQADPTKNLPWMPPFAQTLDNHPTANFIYVQLGINNALDPNGTVAGVEGAVAQMDTICKSKNRRLVLGTPNPVTVFGRPEVNAKLEQMRNAIVKKGFELGIPVIDHWGIAVALPRYAWTKLLADGVHPREDYYRYMGQCMYMGFAYIN